MLNQSEDGSFHLLETEDLDDLLFCLVRNSTEVARATPIAKLTPQATQRSPLQARPKVRQIPIYVSGN